MRIVLEIRIGHERNGGVEDRGRRQHATPKCVQRRDRLNTEDDEAEDEKRNVKSDERENVLLPILRSLSRHF
jgi:hypothetical protein